MSSNRMHRCPTTRCTDLATYTPNVAKPGYLTLACYPPSPIHAKTRVLAHTAGLQPHSIKPRRPEYSILLTLPPCQPHINSTSYYRRYANTQVHGCPTTRCTDVQQPGAQMSNNQVHGCPTARCMDVQQPGARMSNSQVHGCPTLWCTYVQHPSAQCR